MSQTVQALQNFYQYLDRYYQTGQQAPQSPKLLLMTEQLVVQLKKIWQLSPQLILAQLALSPSGVQPVSLIAVKQAALLLAVARKQQWPATVTDLLLCCSLFSLICHSELLSQSQQLELSAQQQHALKNPWRQSLKQQQDLLHQQQWLQIFAGCHLLASNSAGLSWKAPAYSPLLTISFQMALAALGQQQQAPVAIDNQIRQLWWQPQAVPHSQVLQLFAAVGPELYQLGRFCSDQIGDVTFITAAEPKLAGILFDLQLKKLSQQPLELSGAGLTLLPPRLCRDAQWLQIIVDTALNEALEVVTPELSLQQIAELNPNWSVSKQLAWLEQHPSLHPSILHSAQLANRQQKPVLDLKHALAVLGTEQLPALLQQAWLNAQMKACMQPASLWFKQLQQLFSHCLQLIAAQSPQLKMSAQQAQFIAAAFSWHLHQDELARLVPLCSIKPGWPDLAMRCRSLLWQDNQLPREVSQTLASGQLPMIWQDAVLNFRELVPVAASYSQQQVASLLLTFSWQLCSELFFGDSKSGPDLLQCFKNAQHALDLPQHSLAEWLDLLNGQSQSYWPLYADL